MAPASGAAALRRGAAVVAALVLALPSCTVRAGKTSTGADEPSRTYRVTVEQSRRGSGISDTPRRRTTVRARIEERRSSEGVLIRIRDVDASGEPGQVSLAADLVGRSVFLPIGPEGFRSAELGLAGPEDLSAIDVALLFQLVAPIAREAAGRNRALSGIRASWAGGPLALDVEHRAAGRRWVRWVLADRISTRAKGTLEFRIPVARQDSAGSSTARRPLVDQVFATLFAPIEEGDIAGGLASAFAAIPFAVAAPFLALADALSGLVGGGRGGPRYATIPLAGAVDLRETTSISATDDVVLRSTGSGRIRLTGALPELSGDAARLSGRGLALDASWTYTKELVRPWPFGPLVPAVALVLGDAVALVVISRRRSRRPASATPIPV